MKIKNQLILEAGTNNNKINYSEKAIDKMELPKKPIPVLYNEKVVGVANNFKIKKHKVYCSIEELDKIYKGNTGVAIGLLVKDIKKQKDGTAIANDLSLVEVSLVPKETAFYPLKQNIEE